MQSDFAAARELLECAYNQLSGSDDPSDRLRKAIDGLIEEIAAAEFAKAPATVKILPFTRARVSRR